jgi:hypothetical protein
MEKLKLKSSCIACQMGIPKREVRPIVLKDAQGHLSVLSVDAKIYNRIHIYQTKYAREKELAINIDGIEYTIQN